jgi:hypothetical protein
MQKSLGDCIELKASFETTRSLTVFPALSRPRKRILAFLCNRPNKIRLFRNRLHFLVKAAPTKLSENVPEPIQDEHDA